MTIENPRYKFVPPGGDEAFPIHVIGVQEYSPGQSRKQDEWLLEVPDRYHDQVRDGTTRTTYLDICEVLAQCFCGGDVNAVRERMAMIEL